MLGVAGECQVGFIPGCVPHLEVASDLGCAEDRYPTAQVVRLRLAGRDLSPVSIATRLAGGRDGGEKHAHRARHRLGLVEG